MARKPRNGLVEGRLRAVPTRRQYARGEPRSAPDQPRKTPEPLPRRCLRVLAQLRAKLLEPVVLVWAHSRELPAREQRPARARLALPFRPVIPFLLGFLAGSLGSIPPTGPTSLLVLRRALRGRTITALAMAAGGALPEAVYAALALWGFGRLVLWQPWLFWTGPVMAAVVVILSIGDLLRGKLRRDERATLDKDWRQVLEQRRSVVRCFALGFATAALNMTFIFTWGAVAAVVYRVTWLEPCLEPLWLVPVGVFFGVLAWLAVAIAVADRLGAKHLQHEPGQ